VRQFESVECLLVNIGGLHATFVEAIAVSVFAWPYAARAEQTTLPVIGYLSGWSPGDDPEYLNYFRQGLAETGFTEGRNVAIEYRFAAGRLAEVTKLAEDLVRRQVKCHCDTKHN